MSLPSYDQEREQQIQYYLQRREVSLRHLCLVGVWAGGGLLFLLLLILCFTLPLGSEWKVGLLWLDLLGVPGLGVLTWYCLGLFITYQVAGMNLTALRTTTITPPPSQPSTVQLEPSPVPVSSSPPPHQQQQPEWQRREGGEEEEIIPATFVIWPDPQ